jgi:DNA-binding NarL/FixJ family response regulator
MMAAIVCSADEAFVRRCRRRLEAEQEVKVLRGADGLEQRLRLLGPDDLLLVDLDNVQEKNLVAVDAAAAVFVTIPVYEQAVRLLRLGFRAYGNRHMRRDNFYRALSAARAGQIWLPPMILNRLISGFGARPLSAESQQETTPVSDEPLLAALSSREKEVARWIARGLANKEVADRMNITVRTVKAHMTSILGKTGIRDRLELAILLNRSSDAGGPRNESPDLP